MNSNEKTSRRPVHEETDIDDIPIYMQQRVKSLWPKGSNTHGSPLSESLPGVNDNTRTADQETEHTIFSDTVKLMNISTLATKLHEFVKNDRSDDLSQLCRYLTDERGIQLTSEQLLGAKYKETAFHVAVLTGHIECARILSRYGGPELVTRTYSSKEYEGVTALHSAIIKMNVSMVDLIFENLSNDDKSQLLSQEGRPEHTVGKYTCPWIPLHLAASMGNEAVFECLLRHGGDLWIQESVTGNTVLHTLAKMSINYPEESVATFKYIIENSSRLSVLHTGIREGSSQAHRVDEALLKMKNHDGFSAFIYASCIGAVKFAEAITQVEKVYKFSELELVPGSYDLYDMTEMDSSVTSNACCHSPTQKQRCADLSAIEVFVYGISQSGLELGKLRPVNQAMVTKWQSYKYWLLAWFVVHLAVMVCFTVSLQFRPMNQANSTNTTEIMQYPSVGIAVIECFVLIVSVVYFLLEIIDVCFVLRRGYMRAVSLKPEGFMVRIRLAIQGEIHRPLLFFFSISVFAILVLRVQNSEWQDAAYCMGSLFGWCFMLFFTRAFKNVGIFTTMLREMVLHVLAYFAVVLLIFMIAYGTAMFALFQSTNGKVKDVQTIQDTYFTLFRLFVSLLEFDMYDEARLHWGVKMLFVAFVLQTNILLMNMLIAAMNNSFLKLDQNKNLMWLKMRTNAVLMIERRLPRCMKPKNNWELYNHEQRWFIKSLYYHKYKYTQS